VVSAVGVEIELVAPRGMTRRDIAVLCAEETRGTICRFFHPQAEPSLAAGSPVFETLTQGFRVIDRDGRWFADFVDDMTLRDDLRREAAPESGWYRIAGDDARLMRLIARHADPDAPCETVLDPLADLFGGELRRRGPMTSLVDAAGAPIAISAPLPGERERACEIVTRPMRGDEKTVLHGHIGRAVRLGFMPAAESAMHIHLDATGLQSASAMHRLVQLFSSERQALHTLAQPNSRCRRLGPWPKALVDAVSAPDFIDQDWPEARRRLKATGTEKYCDFNIVNILDGRPEKRTFEFRILPVHMDVSFAQAWIGLLRRMLAWVETGEGAPPAVAL